MRSLSDTFLPAIVLGLLAILAVAAPVYEWLWNIDPNAVDLLSRYAPASFEHPLGMDELGRDVVARLLRGGRVSLSVGFVAALVASVIGTVIGLLAGYFGGRFDALLMRLTDSVIALPLLPLLIVLAAVDMTKLGIPASIAQSPDANLYRIIVITGLVSWTTVARLVRGTTLALREREFVLAAIGQGAGSLRVMFVHILPNAAAPIIVASTLAVGNVILFESVLSFLGLGIQPPVASWGNMLTNAQETIWSAPALAIYPGLLILITVATCNLLGDRLREAFDPRSQRV